MIYLQLFWAFFQIGLFSFGGGYAALPLISQQVISTYHWISQNTFTDLITISQMTPGPIAVNSSTFVGQYVAHLPGALIATIGCILPSCILVSLLAYFYVKYKDMKVMKTILSYLRPASIDVQLRTSEHRSMYSYVRLSIDRCTATTSDIDRCTLLRLSIIDVQYVL